MATALAVKTFLMAQTLDFIASSFFLLAAIQTDKSTPC